MKLAVVHYHLNRGGVTRVIENQLLALDGALDDRERHEVFLLYGGRHEGWHTGLADRLQRVQLQLQPVIELDYDSERPRSTGSLGSRLVSALQEAGFSPAETIVHFHNHAIGKNAALPRAVWDLAQRGYGMLLQIHDFAEDQRPDNFRLLANAGSGQADWHGRLYPQAPNVHFAVLNGRDRDALRSADLPPGRLHLLPNPVLPPATLPDHESARSKLKDLFSVPLEARFVLYPVRGIRRKNLGEALLHSVLAPDGTFHGLTLPPLNPAERTGYEAWKTAAERWQPPFLFEVGVPGALSFAENLAASDAILTTSIAEGFGMVYLESWLCNRALVGRDLPEITRDFTAAGLDLSGVRDRLEIPTDWLDMRRLRQMLYEAVRSTSAAYGRESPHDLFEQVDAKLRGDTIDFGDLDEGFQVDVIGRVVAESSARRELLAANPWLASPVETVDRKIVKRNAEVVHREFSLAPSGSRLIAVYDAIRNSPRGQEIQPLAQPVTIVDRFLAVNRFRLLRS